MLRVLVLAGARRATAPVARFLQSKAVKPGEVPAIDNT
jgi:hypothetical protein